MDSDTDDDEASADAGAATVNATDANETDNYMNLDCGYKAHRRALCLQWLSDDLNQ